MVGCEVGQKDGSHMQGHRRERRLTNLVSCIWTPGRATSQWGSLPCARSPSWYGGGEGRHMAHSHVRKGPFPNCLTKKKELIKQKRCMWNTKIHQKSSRERKYP